MIFFYWRIYIVASRTTRAFKRGYKRTKKGKNSQANRSDESLTLRIHRRYICAESNFQASSDKTLVSPSVSDEIPSEDSTSFTKSSVSTYGSTKSTKNINNYSSTHLQVPIEKRFRRNKSATVYGSPGQVMINSKPEKYIKNNQFKGNTFIHFNRASQNRSKKLKKVVQMVLEKRYSRVSFATFGV